jgi:hypothetical protein
MMFGDFGHQRASNQPAERARLIASIHRWMDHYLRGAAGAPTGVVASTQTCPRDAPADGPYRAPTFAALARGEVRYASRDAQTIEPSGGDPNVGKAIDPVGGGGDACATTASADQAGTATYRLPAATGVGYTLLGAPTIHARLKVTGEPAAAQVAGRLWDVAPGGGSQTLVARGVYRPTGVAGGEVWQLHANGWRFKAGHVPKLELLGSDPPSSRPSNGAFEVAVEKLELRLPVRDRPRLRLRIRCTGGGTRATATVRGARARYVDFFARGRLVARDRRRPFSRLVLKPGRTRHPVRIVARAAITGRVSIRKARSTRGCRS